MIEIRKMTEAEMAARDMRPGVAGAVPASAAEAMAADMLDIAATHEGACLDADLRLRGWTQEALLRHGLEANRIAIARAVADIGCGGSA